MKISVSYVFEKLVLLIVMGFLAKLTLVSESRDWHFLEDLRTHLLDKQESITIQELEDVAMHTERIRRVTWRSGVLGAGILACMLVACRLITWDQWVAAAIPSWVMITSVMNFRAYHVEDEQTRVLRRFLADNRPNCQTQSATGTDQTHDHVQ